MIASQQSDSGFVPDFQSKQIDDCFNTVESPIHEIAKKEVVDEGCISSNFKQLQQIIELSMYIPADGHRWVDACEVCFFGEYLLGLIAQYFNLLFVYELVLLNFVEYLISSFQILFHLIISTW